MRVMCINDSGWYTSKSILWGVIKWNKNTSGPTYGDICNVIREEIINREVYYHLLEWPTDHDGPYNSDGFIPLTGEEETELIEETETFIKDW